jgi:polyhydroxyalkanoate synthase
VAQSDSSEQPAAEPRGGRVAADVMVQETIDALTGALPLGLSPTQSVAAAARLAGSAIRQPRALAERTAKLAWEELKVITGFSDVEPERGDRRFTDDWFDDNPLYRRMMQWYLAWNRELYGLLADLELDPKSTERARFLMQLYTETIAPTNFLLGNPAALRKAVETRGRSVLQGLRHMRYDLLNNNGMPSMVDTRPFALGDTIAATPGSVVFRNEQLELIQYAPQTETVRERPLLFVPPQINRYYILDLAPDRSLVEHAVRDGQQVFMISWRNPDKEMRDWDLDTYVTAISEAMDAALEITGSDDLNIAGVCAGGITTAALLGHLAAVDDRRVNAATFLVTVLDWSHLSTVGTFVSTPTVVASVEASRRQGVLSGQQLAAMFAWLRPNDLVWNYWVNNYLMGQNPPAFDVLAWNQDSTDLPAGLHADFMLMAKDNSLATPGAAEALGTPIDLSSVEMDHFVVGAVNDHITPWQGCYETTRLLSGDATFVLSSAGHIVAMVNPPSKRNSSYFRDDDRAGEVGPEEWKQGAEEHEGTWWHAWTAWLAERSGDEVEAPAAVGSETHQPILPAPGTYVRA